MENGGPALKQKEKVCFSDFWHFSDNFAQYNTTRPLPKLKKHHPTNLYMLYPMAQSVALFLVENVKKMTLQKHCPLSSFIITIIHFTVGEANNTPACQPEALPARYRRTASISTYTYTFKNEDFKLLKNKPRSETTIFF
jgi:hypothetical protein